MKRLTLILPALLSSCGTPAPTNTTAATDASAAGPAKRWDATDACAVVDKAAMAAAVGAPVSEATVALVHQANGAEAATSQCSYIFENGSRGSVMLRWSPIADNDDGAIAATLSTLSATTKAFGASVENVTDVGKATFWVAKTDTLNVFIDDASLAIITLPSDAQSKSKAIALARRLGAA